MRVREKRKLNRKNKNKIRKNETRILKKIDTLPLELVAEIQKFLPLHIQNIIQPLDNLLEIREYLVSNYWVNFYLYFWEYFQHDDATTKKRIKHYFEKIKDIQYLKINKKIYPLKDEFTNQKLVEIADAEVSQFHYGKRQHDRNVEERIRLCKSKIEIQNIINSF